MGLACLALPGHAYAQKPQPGRPAGTPAADPNVAAIAQISAALQSNDFNTALTLCRTALQHTPGDPRVWTLQAIAQASANKGAAAAVSYHQAIKIAPKYVPAWQGLGQMEYAAHNPTAQQTLEHVVALAPQDQMAHAMLGALAYSRKDCPAAVTEFAEARAVVSTRPDTALQWGSCLMQLGRPQEAASVLSAALAAAPNDRTLRYDTSLAQWKGGYTATADETLGPLLTAAHPASDALALGAAIAEEQNNTQRALDLLRNAILANPKNHDAYLDFARLALDHGSAQVGIDMVNIGLRNLPDDAELYFARGVLVAQNGKLDDAMADLDRASKLDPRLSFVGTAQGIAASQAHQFAAAEQRLRVQTQQHPTDAAAWYLLAEALADQSLATDSIKHKEMVHAAEEAVRLDPKNADAHSQLASIYMRDHDAKRAIMECNAALAVTPDDPQIIYQLLLATRSAGQKEQLPELVKRLTAAREGADAKAKSNRKQLLMEVPPATTPGSPQ